MYPTLDITAFRAALAATRIASTPELSSYPIRRGIAPARTGKRAIAATFGLSAVLAPLLCVGVLSAGAAETGATVSVVRIGATEKVCQLTGDTDWETGRPTAARTLANFGLGAVDLGYPVEHAGKLILLFGDTWPPRHPGGAIAEAPPDDSVGVTTRRAPPGNDGECLEM